MGRFWDHDSMIGWGAEGAACCGRQVVAMEVGWGDRGGGDGPSVMIPVMMMGGSWWMSAWNDSVAARGRQHAMCQ